MNEQHVVAALIAANIEMILTEIKEDQHEYSDAGDVNGQIHNVRHARFPSFGKNHDWRYI